jgi:hypothetical protein
MKNRIQFVQENINRLKSLIESSKKTENYDQDMLKKHINDLAVFQIEISKLIREEWEETHERLDYGDDR